MEEYENMIGYVNKSYNYYMHKLNIINSHFSVTSGQTLLKTSLPSGWEYDRSKSKLNIEDAKRVYCMTKYPEEYRILDIIKQNYEYL